MNASIFDGLQRDWDIAAGWFQPHHQPQPYDEHHQTSREEPMPLADTAAQIQDRATAAQAGLQNSVAGLHDVLDNHLAALVGQHLPELAAITAGITGSPLVQAALGAAHVPPELLAPIADVLNAYAAAHARPEAPAEQPEPQPA